MSLAIIRTATGAVVTIVRPDQPAGWKPPAGCHTVPESSLAPGYALEPRPAPPPISDTLCGITLTASDGRLNIPARVVIGGSDVQVTDSDRGLLLRDDLGHDWLLTIVDGAPVCIQVSASPECSHTERQARLTQARKKVTDAKVKNEGKGKSVSDKERLDRIEAILGIAPA